MPIGILGLLLWNNAEVVTAEGVLLAVGQLAFAFGTLGLAD
jgi:hypothetical protein